MAKKYLDDAGLSTLVGKIEEKYQQKLSSINGLAGGSLTTPLVVKGGDSATSAKIALDQTQAGQITNNGTQTLFGFTSNNATSLTVGHSSYALALRGSGTRPKFNGNDLALYSDVSSGGLTPSEVVDLVYPVGSYFITESSSYDTVAKVQAHFGGTWVRVEGRFLYGSSSAGSTGGSNNAIVVSHSHTFTGTQGTTNSDGSHDHFISSYNNAGSRWLSNNSTAHHNNFGVGADDQSVTASSSYRTGSGGSHTHTFTPSGTVSTEGSAGTNANMPAYRTVFMYRRTA